MQGIKPSLFLAAFELQNSSEHCGAHAKSVIQDLTKTMHRWLVIILLHCDNGTHLFRTSSIMVPCGQIQPGTHAAGQTTFGSLHVDRQSGEGAHSVYTCPSTVHSCSEM